MMERGFLSAMVMSVIILLFVFPLQGMPPSAQLFPALLLGCMVVFNIGQYIMAYMRHQAHTAPAALPGSYPGRRVLLIFGLTLAYLGSLQTVGFYPASVVFFVLTSLLTQPQTVTPALALRRAAACTAFVGFLYVLFTVFLKVQIPKGFMGF